ncbi:MAG: hypothetical protein JOZ88_11865 [Hyphomicrobiales bacterium]|nr:hypothetical protein [Hyphomicrobiales bacterium]
MTKKSRMDQDAPFALEYRTALSMPRSCLATHAPPHEDTGASTTHRTLGERRRAADPRRQGR